MAMQRFNQGKAKLSKAGYPLTCPKCLTTLLEDDGYAWSNEKGLRVEESNYHCDCGYKLLISEEAPFLYQEPAEY